MKAIKYLLTISIFATLISSVSAQQKRDPVEIYGAGKDIVKVSEFNDIRNSNNKWVRADIVLDGKENPDKTAKTAEEKKWIRDVSLDLLLVYCKPNVKDKWNPENWIILKSKADLIAIEKGKKSIVSFFISPELKDLYKLQDSQRLFFIIDLSVMGNKIELSQKNLKKFISRSLASKIKNMKQFEKIKSDLEKASTVNDSWLVPLSKAPFIVQYEEYYGGNKQPSYVIPTYKVESK